MILITPKVLEYIRNDSGRSNRFDCIYTKDHCGRVLLPLDTVIMTAMTDEGIHLLICGDIIELDDFNQSAKIRPNKKFQDSGFQTNMYDTDNIIRFPWANFHLSFELSLFFTSINQLAIGDKVLHVNGKPIVT